jgi:hypothetical protein
MQLTHRFRDKCLIALCILWLLLIFCIISEVGTSFKNIRSEADNYIYWAGGLLAIQQFFIQNHSNREWLVRLSYIAQIVVVVVGILTYFPAVKYHFFAKDENQLVAEMVHEVRDSTGNFESKVNLDSLFTDCQRAGLSIKKYRSTLVTHLLDRNNIPARDTARYIAKVDSAIIDPMTASCNRVNQFAQMVFELSMLIRTKNARGIDELFMTYNISPTAKAIELRDGQLFSHGLLRDFLIDTMQDLTPTFNEIRPPAYSKNNEPIQQLIFTTT